MYCHKCGKEIDDEAVVCVNCGVSTKNMQSQDNSQPVIINNSSSSSSSASAAATSVKIQRKRSLLFDIIMICLTGGLWIIWMIVRPKYY